MSDNRDDKDNQPGDNRLGEVNWQIAQLRLRNVELATQKLADNVGTLRASLQAVIGVVDNGSVAVLDQLTAVEELKGRFPRAS